MMHHRGQEVAIIPDHFHRALMGICYTGHDQVSRPCSLNHSTALIPVRTSSTIGGGGRGCNIFLPVLGGNGTKIAPTGDIFDQPPGQMR